jgi:hypothetical protein
MFVLMFVWRCRMRASARPRPPGLLAERADRATALLPPKGPAGQVSPVVAQSRFFLWRKTGKLV